MNRICRVPGRRPSFAPALRRTGNALHNETENLKVEMVSVARDTVQPTRVSLWSRQDFDVREGGKERIG